MTTRYIGGEVTELTVAVEPRLEIALENAAARMGFTPDELVAGLLSSYLDQVTEEDIDPELRRRRAAARAKELLR